jgi:hypothetical protein
MIPTRVFSKRTKKDKKVRVSQPLPGLGGFGLSREHPRLLVRQKILFEFIITLTVMVISYRLLHKDRHILVRPARCRTHPFLLQCIHLLPPRTGHSLSFEEPSSHLARYAG